MNEKQSQHVFAGGIRTAQPLSPYIALAASFLILVLLFLKGQPILKSAFYSIFTFLFIYTIFSRDSCSLEVNQTHLIVHYFWPWQKNISIQRDAIISIDFEKGFYDFWNMKSRARLSPFPLYCSDALILTLQENGQETEKSILCNTRMFQFDRILKTICSENTSPRPQKK